MVNEDLIETFDKNLQSANGRWRTGI